LNGPIVHGHGLAVHRDCIGPRPIYYGCELFFLRIDA
jgi:hypothetical protein